MLAEMIKSIVDLARGAHKVSFESHPSLRNKVFVQHGDQVQEHEAALPPRKHCVDGLDDLLVFVQRPEFAETVEIFYSAAEIRALLDGNTRREESVLMALRPTTRFQTLCDLQKPRSFSVRDAVKFLRFELHGGTVGTVIDALSSIDFTRKSDGRQAAGHGRESLGKAVEAAVQNADRVPEEFTVRLPAFSNPGCKGFQVQVTCGVFLDLQNECVEIRVLADEIERELNAVVNEIGQAMRSELPESFTDRIFEGRP